MNKTIPSFTFVALLLLFTSASAQQTTQKFLSKIPALPTNICEANDEVIMKWNDRILALKNEMIELQTNEKNQMEQAQANTQPRMDMFEPANAEKIQKLGEEIQIVETDANAILTEIITPFIEKHSSLELKYSALFEQLEQQKQDAKSQGRNTTIIEKKICDAKKEKCAEMSVLRSDYLTDFKNHLDKLINLGIKGNELSDEMTRMSYSGYTFHTQYGFWLGFLIGYVDELSHFYDDVPICNTEKI